MLDRNERDGRRMNKTSRAWAGKVTAEARQGRLEGKAKTGTAKTEAKVHRQLPRRRQQRPK